MKESPENLLLRYWNHHSFRPLQREIIEAVLQGRDVLALLPTGGGKSVCFQVPALAREGLCLVISPLIALMKDQVENLRRRGIEAQAVYAGMSYKQIDHALDNCVYGSIKFLYVSPERLKTELFQERLRKMKVNLLAVDEAHCVSAWGYDFRPPYLQIAAFRQTYLPQVPLLALTATATAEVQADILNKLGMSDPLVFRQSFARPNLSYSAFPEENKEQKLRQILERVHGPAVVYVRSRRRTQLVANGLSRSGIPATFYHAGLNMADRHTRQEAWLKGRVRVMVATNAFGMGIDKPDVRTVVHLDLPDTLEAYFQEAGRAGRDGQKAYAIVLFSPGDPAEIIRQVDQGYPPPATVRRVYQCLANFYKLAVGSGQGAGFDFDQMAFQTTFGLGASETYHALRLLQSEGYLQLSEAYHQPSRLHFRLDPRELYDFQLRNEHFDAFTKLLLRLYGGGLYSDFVIISENALAKHFMAPEADVRKLLEQLKQMEVVDYEPQKNRPQLTFLTPRLPADTLPLAERDIAARHERDLRKAGAVGAYVQNRHRCRTQQLLAYFRENDAENCGICDVCTGRYRTLPSADKQQVLALLAAGPLSPEALVQALPTVPEPKLVVAVRELLAEERLRYDPRGVLVVC